jgi:hypothetical protein
MQGTKTSAASESVVSTQGQHLPGPWIILPPPKWDSDAEWSVLGVANCGNAELSEANARLIAAAPDMWASGYAADTCLSLAYGYARDLGKHDEAAHILKVQFALRASLAKAEAR